jgi:acyl-[acyl-carrier-protein]-phospholipid O-acyltransferase / long-chain-fatty-acid--[acyl-carrier-protein] ligase
VFTMPFAWITGQASPEWLDLLLIPLVVALYFALAFIFPGVTIPLFRVVVAIFWPMKVIGRENIPTRGGALLVSNHVSYIDWLLVFAATRRRLRIVIWSGYRRNPIIWFFITMVRTIPIEGRKLAPGKINRAFDTAKQALANGELVCIFAEGRLTRTSFMRPFHRGLELLEKKIQAPIIPVALTNVWGSIFTYRRGRTIWKLPERCPVRVGVGFGKPLSPDTPAWQVRQAIQRLSAECARLANHWSVPVHRRFVRQAARHPFRSCFIDPATKRELNYSKALAGAMCLSNWLRPKLGPEPMVGIWLPSSMAGAMANIVLALLGKTSVNLNYTSSKESVLSAVRQTGMKQILTSRLFLAKVPLDIPAHEEAPDGEKVQLIYLENAAKQIGKRRPLLAFLKVLLLPGIILERLVLGLGRHSLDDLATIIFTSGSTGEPKGVMLSHRNIAANAESMIQAVDFTEKDRILGCLPFFHSFGYTVTLWAPIQVGGSVVYYPDPRQAKEIGELCKKHQCTIMLSTATFLRFHLKRSAPDDFKSVRVLICGAEKLPPSLAEEFHRKFGMWPLEGYGCTELAPVAASNVPDCEVKGVKQIGNKAGSVGQPLPGIAAKIVDPETWEEAPVGHDGMVLVTGANVMVGYLNKPELTREVIRDGWYVTGDMGHMDEDGFITLTGRLSRFAKIGGEMVPLQKVEDELHEALNLTDRVAAVTSVPDAAKGERVVIVHVKLNMETREVCQKLAERKLPNLWLPKERDFIQVPELPLLGSGKVDLMRVKQIALEKAGGKN